MQTDPCWRLSQRQGDLACTYHIQNKEELLVDDGVRLKGAADAKMQAIVNHVGTNLIPLLQVCCSGLLFFDRQSCDGAEVVRREVSRYHPTRYIMPIRQLRRPSPVKLRVAAWRELAVVKAPARTFITGMVHSMSALGPISPLT